MLITIERLRKLFTKPLPGIKAQQLMSPSNRYTVNNSLVPGEARESSVFILLFQDEGEWHIPLIKRPVYNGAHSGQVSLPGGKKESNDKNLLQTAYRETEEEIGIAPDLIDYAGTLTTLYIPNSNFNVTPQVGLISSNPVFKKDPQEVEEIIKLPFSALFDRSAVRYFERNVNSHTISAPYYCCDEHIIWGATAMMLSEFAEVIRESSLLKIS